MIRTKTWDRVLLFFLSCFLFISVLTIYSASTYLSPDLGNLPLKQIIFYAIGFIFLIIIKKIGYTKLCQLAWYFYGIGIISLLLLFPFGTTINNSTCWYTLPGIGSIQPSEFMKIALILVLSKLTIEYRKKKNRNTSREEIKYIGKSLIIVIVPSVITFLEPDTGAVLLYFIILFIMLLFSGIRFRWFLIGATIILSAIGTFFYLYFLAREQFINFFGTSLFYRVDRLLDWNKGAGYQLENALTAMGSAGWLGHGFNKTPLYFPESGTDFIFAVFASNFGYIGSLVLLLILFSFDYYLLLIARKNKEKLPFYLLIGILSILLYQQVQNIGMTLGMLPITGITLPFISYGGSSLLSYFILLGIVFSIQKENKKKRTII